MNAKERTALLATLKTRFDAHAGRHKDITWSQVQARLDAAPDKLVSLAEMERTGGEPDVVNLDKKTGAVTFMDCSAETPIGRRSLCYDRESLDARKENKPEGSAMELAQAMGVEMLTEEQYRQLQKLGAFDLKTSSWVRTPPAIRKLGGALFCDRRYDHVFVYHNGAQSYYAARGFRGAVTV
jgi:hypothetical protein